MKKGYKKCPFCANEIKEEAKKCQYCKEYLDQINKEIQTVKKTEKSNNKPGKGRRFLVVLYFIITIPILLGVIFGFIGDAAEIRVWVGNIRHYIFNYYYLIFWGLVTILAYLLITNFLRRICSFIGNGTFKGFINYRNIFTKYLPYTFIILVLLISLFILSLHKENKYNCGEGKILSEELSCICDSENGYEEDNGICKRDDFYKLDDSVVEYINENQYLANSIKTRYYIDNERINDNEGIIIFVDTSIKGGSEPEEITYKYSDEWSCPSQVEGITSAVGQGYVIAYEKKGDEFIINDFYEVPSMHSYIDSYYNALAYPIYNTKLGNYLSYDGEEPTSEKDKELLERTKIINLKDVDGDGKKLEFFIMNYFDQVCGTYNYLLLGYDEKNKTIKEYVFNRYNETDYYYPRVSLTDGSQNQFKGGVLKQQYYGGSAHRGPCDESWEYKFRKDGDYNYFDIQNYKKGHCEY